MKDQTNPLCDWMSNTTEEEWMAKLRGKSLKWLIDQEILKDSNGLNYYKALRNCILEKYESGEDVAKILKAPYFKFEEEDDVIIQHIPTGPKGQTTRVAVPRCLCAD